MKLIYRISIFSKNHLFSTEYKPFRKLDFWTRREYKNMKELSERPNCFTCSNFSDTISYEMDCFQDISIVTVCPFERYSHIIGVDDDDDW